MHDLSSAVNPFAAPISASVRGNSEGVRKGRASEVVLRRLCRHLAVAEVSYALACASMVGMMFLTAFCSNAEAEILYLFACLPWLFFMVTWACLMSIHQVVQGWVAAIGLMITFPIPLLGSLIFLSEAKHANKFLFRNGYERTFLGGKPNDEERRRMEADANYCPNVYVGHNGEQRGVNRITLGLCALLVLIGGFITAISL